MTQPPDPVDAEELDRLLGDGWPSAEVLEGLEGMVALVVPGERAEKLWDVLRSLVDRTGRWPLILGERRRLRALVDPARRSSRSTAEILEEAARLDPGKIAAIRQMVERTGLEDLLAADVMEFPSSSLGEGSIEMLREQRRKFQARPRSPDAIRRDLDRGRWPEEKEPSGEPGSSPLAYRVHDGPLPEVVVGLIPAVDGAEAPAWLRMGGRQVAEQLVAFLRSWERRFGAELVGLTHDGVEIRLERPPASREEAVALAYEVGDCPVGFGSPGDLEDLLERAASLLGLSRLFLMRG